MAQTIQEYLSWLGFRVDENSRRKFDSTLTTTAKRAAALGAAVEAAAVVVEAATTKMASRLEGLYWASKRTGQSAENIGAFSYAVSQLGGSADGAKASLKSVADFLQYNPGGGRFLQSIGVDATQVALGNLDELGQRLHDFWEQGPAGRARAKNIADFLGIDNNTFRALIDGDLKRWEQHYRDLLKRFGLTQEEAARQGKEFMQLQRDLGTMLQLVWTKVGTGVMPEMERIGRGIQQYFSDPANVKRFNAEVVSVVHGLEDLLRVAATIGRGGVKLFDWLEEEDTKTGGLSTRILAIGAALSSLGLLPSLLNPATLALVGLAGGIAAVVAAGDKVPKAPALGSPDVGMTPAEQAADRARNPEKYDDEDYDNVVRNWGVFGPVMGTLYKLGVQVPKAFQQALSGILVEVASMGDEAKLRDSLSGRDDRFKVALNFFRGKGWSAPQAAGIVANLSAESKLDPTAVGDQGAALGLGQWHPDRQADFAAKFHKSLGTSSLQEQLEFVDYELGRGKFKAVGDKLRHLSTAAGAGQLVSREYERPRDELGAQLERGRLASYLSDRYLGDDGSAAAANHDVTLNQTTNIHVTASGSAPENAQAIAGEQDRVTSRAIEHTRARLR